MRLTCPNCGAQYEVPDEVIPETGRDVQCSNCGDTWFQAHPDHQSDDDRLDDVQEDAQYDTAPEPAPEPAPQTGAEGRQSYGDDDEYGADYDADPEPQSAPQDDDPYSDDPYSDDAPEDDAPPSRRELDPSIRDLLREEAAREEQARAAEAGASLETQPDLGLDDGPDTRTQEARSRMARLRGLSDEDETAPAKNTIDPDSRRNLLPDIDEINSSLDAAPRRDRSYSDEDDALAVPSGGGGFRRGFVWAIALFAGLTLLYVFAPQIAGLSPALEGPMAAYVEMVNALRALLQSSVASLLG